MRHLHLVHEPPVRLDHERQLRGLPSSDRIGEECLAEIRRITTSAAQAANRPRESSGANASPVPEARPSVREDAGRVDSQGAEAVETSDEPDPYFTDTDREDDGNEDGWRGL